MISQPLLAPHEVPMSYPNYWKRLKYPYLVSPKFDGIRGVVQSGKVLSRRMKLLRSYQVQGEFSALPKLDGELIIGEPTAPEAYNLCQSHIMSFNKPHDDLRYYVFDCFENTYAPFHERLSFTEQLLKELNHPRLHFVSHSVVENQEELLAYEDQCLKAGYEGVMLRNPNGRYKENRATFLENIIYKLKRFTDDEGVVVGFIEAQGNMNSQERDERGYAKRSKAAEGLIGMDTLGAFLVDWKGTLLTVPPGKFAHKTRKSIWDRQDLFLHKILKFRYFGYGVKDLPRHPRAIGFRDPKDM